MQAPLVTHDNFYAHKLYVQLYIDNIYFAEDIKQPIHILNVCKLKSESEMEK